MIKEQGSEQRRGGKVLKRSNSQDKFMLLCREASARWSYFRFIYPLACLYLQLACPAWSRVPSAPPPHVCCLFLLLFSHPCRVAHPCISDCFPCDSFRLVDLFMGRWTVCFCLLVPSTLCKWCDCSPARTEQTVWTVPCLVRGPRSLTFNLNTRGPSHFGTTSWTAPSCFKPANCWIQSFRVVADMQTNPEQLPAR